MGHNITEAELNRAITALRSKGIPDDQITEVLGAMQFGEQPMSSSDGSYRAESQPDVPGTYISAEQQLQDNYAGGIAAQQAQQSSGLQSDPLHFLKVPNHNVGVVMSSSNPNYKVVTEGQRQTVDANGNVVIY